MTKAAESLRELSEHFDAANKHRFSRMTRKELESELRLLHRSIKVGEEFGEVVDAIIGATGANPRKGVYGEMADVIKEELDVALTALGNVEHMTGNRGVALGMLEEHIMATAARAFGSSAVSVALELRTPESLAYALDQKIVAAVAPSSES